MNDDRYRMFHVEPDYYDGRASGLLSNWQSRLPKAAEQIRRSDPRYSGASDDEIFNAAYTHDDARLVTAREHGLGSWDDLVELLVSAGASVAREALGSGGTPLMMALFWGHRETADYLGSLDVVPRNLRAAAGVGRVDLLAEFFDGAGRLLPAAGASRGFYRPHSGFPVWTPSGDPQEILDEAFVYAAKCGRIATLQFFLEHGAHIEADPYRGTALIWACCVRDNHEAINWLLDHGTDVNQKATFGGPSHGQGIVALHLAAQRGDLAVVKLLISRGADPAITDDLYGGAAIGHAAHFGKTEVQEYLESLSQSG